jgi:RNA polymerase sigma-70 factor, ECF subfamily
VVNVKSSVAKPPVDDELLQGLQAQQPNVLTRLYDSYGDMMCGLAYRIINSRQDAEDVVQDVFLRLWNHCSYNPDRGSFQTFLMIMVRSRSLDRLRSHQSQLKNVQRSGRLQNETDGQTPLEIVAADEIGQRVQRALADLPDKQRQAIELSYFGGLTQQEISQHLEVPLGTVKSYFRLSFAKLRQSLQDLIR